MIESLLSRRRSGASVQLLIKVGPDAAPLLEFVLEDAGFTWSELEVTAAGASVLIDVTDKSVPRTLAALRQRLGCHLEHLSALASPITSTTSTSAT